MQDVYKNIILPLPLSADELSTCGLLPLPGFGRPHLVLEATLPYGLAMI